MVCMRSLMGSFQTKMRVREAHERVWKGGKRLFEEKNSILMVGISMLDEGSGHQ